MAAYVIANIKVTDPAGYEGYKKLAGAAIEACGGRYLLRGGKTDVLEGEWHPHGGARVRQRREGARVMEFNSIRGRKKYPAEHCDKQRNRGRGDLTWSGPESGLPPPDGLGA